MRELLKTHGPGTVLSYLTVSNTISVSMLCSTWLLFTRSTGQTPLQAWPQFLAMWAGMWAAQQAVRPVKVAMGLAGTPIGTAVVTAAARLFRVNNTAALVVLLVLEAVVLLGCLGLVALHASHMVG